MNLNDYQWEFKKKLFRSDVDHSSRLLVPRKIVDNLVFCHLTDEEKTQVNEGDGVRVKVRDLNETEEYEMTFKMWKSTKSYIFVDNWSRDFVRRRELQEGDEIGMFWNCMDSILCFDVLERNEDQSFHEAMH
ncbi:putative B3 domain-containing protein At1g78640 [Macadamia integrifolia]|uniref:putative B3 domain-containing protein At1g78640 n=1 Tax=Macadamia integrifolia TaxID=60698 RepID=UPI001C4E95AB|nr:putative B3 domain-containing protein At1g78640 [Macadamia integrifolia]